jgi:serine/threonine-protein kinase
VLHGLSGQGSPAPAAATNKLDTTQGIVLNARDYVGRQVDEVADELAHRGLSVQRRPVDGVDGVDGAVTAVSPSGTPLAFGAVVTVSYLVREEPTTVRRAPQTPVQVRPDTATGTGTGAGTTEHSTRSSSTLPTTTATPPTSPTTDSSSDSSSDSTSSSRSAGTRSSGGWSSSSSASSSSSFSFPDPDRDRRDGDF